MDNESPSLHLIGDETDGGLCVDGACAVPQSTEEAGETELEATQ
jgi:hypothetical protein